MVEREVWCNRFNNPRPVVVTVQAQEHIRKNNRVFRDSGRPAVHLRKCYVQPTAMVVCLAALPRKQITTIELIVVLQRRNRVKTWMYPRQVIRFQVVL